MGGPQRLDFTVIGRAVNAAALIEALTKSVQRPILTSGAVAKHLEVPLDDLGRYAALRGLKEPMALFAPSDVKAGPHAVDQ